MIIPKLPSKWVPEVAIFEGMFLIQTLPIPNMGCMREYVEILLGKSVYPHLNARVSEVHVVFDNPSSLAETPKDVEHKKRDSNQKESFNYECVPFSSESAIPNRWRDVLSCRLCKKALTH